MDVEDLLALLHVGKAHLDLTVETSGAHERLVQDVGTVGRRKDDDTRIGLETVHLRKELVQRIFALVVARKAGILAAGPANGVDLVDEDDAGSLFLGLLEEVAHLARAHADEHLHELRTGHGEKRHVRLTGNGLGQQRLAGSRRAHEQRPLRDLGTQLLVFVGLLEEIDNLHDLDLGLLESSHVLERHALRIVLVEDLRLGLAHIHDAASTAGPASAGHRTHDEEPRSDDDYPRQQVDQHRGPVVLLVLVDHRDTSSRSRLDGLKVLAEGVHRSDREDKLHARLGQARKLLVLRIVAVTLDRLFRQVDLSLVAVHDLDALHIALLDHPLDRRPIARKRRIAAVADNRPADDEYRSQTVEPEKRGPRHVHTGFIAVSFCRHCLLLFFVFVMLHGSIGPQLLQAVEAAQLGLEDVHHDIHVVHGDPQGVLLPFDAPDLLAELFEHLLLDARGNGGHLRRGVRIADHELRTDGTVESRKVQRYDVLSLFIFNRADDRFDQFVHKFLSISICVYNLAKVRNRIKI